MAEESYPITHPAHPQYKPKPFVAASIPFATDYTDDHPAYQGKNVGVLDSPDGMRQAHLQQTTNLQELAAIGSLPPVVDPDTGEALSLTAEQLAYIYAVRKGLNPQQQQQVTDTYGLAPIELDRQQGQRGGLTAEQQARLHIMSFGYTPERADEIIAQYGAPSVLRQKDVDATR